ncbi:lycopene epsilon cyclase, chloroplastic isoform X7 [Malania oleifera]|uniref:lycopene epsilon cyclase, chloroplastic isoform X7 n=1 Tax=Malania oleifera TaxID=397392 RepID=UPI0025AEB879|nr:lycopene epsilon cyclase, chloroplastic isoform X7 [Malania oleifera]
MMECLGARNFAAMAVFSPCVARWSRRRRSLITVKHTRAMYGQGSCVRSLRARAGARNESCVDVKECFADEEDYIKAGGSELLFVQMQQNKAMEKQSKLADKLPQISTGDSIMDLVVIGCGPAGLALAAESAKLGLNVGLIGPDLPFTNNYGVWEDEFRDLGLEGCIEHVWRDTVVYLDDGDPIMIGRAYGRVSRRLLHEELLKRCVESGVSYLCSKVERIVEATNGHSLVACEHDIVVPCRLATVASGAASGKLLQYEVGGPRVSVQTAYGLEVEDLSSGKTIGTAKAYEGLYYFEKEWSYIPVGGSLPNTAQKTIAFGAAASMVHPATGYSVVRSLSEAPKYASKIANILKRDHSKDTLSRVSCTGTLSVQAWNTLWPQERKRQRAFFLFGLALILQLDIEGIRTFFHTFFRLPKWMWEGFLGSTLSSADLVLFALYMFVIAPNDMRKCLIRHLLSDPTGATMLRTFLAI